MRTYFFKLIVVPFAIRALALSAAGEESNSLAAPVNTLTADSQGRMADADEAFRKLRLIEREIVPAEVQADHAKLAEWTSGHIARLRPPAMEFYTRYAQDP